MLHSKFHPLTAPEHSSDHNGDGFKIAIPSQSGRTIIPVTLSAVLPARGPLYRSGLADI
jgi:hypothetical protein